MIVCGSIKSIWLTRNNKPVQVFMSFDRYIMHYYLFLCKITFAIKAFDKIYKKSICFV